MNKLAKKLLVIPQTVSYFFLTSAVLGQGQITDWIEEVDEGVGDKLEDWLPEVLLYAIGFAALVSIAVIIGSGYMYITAAGDEEKVRKAGKAMTYAVVGLIVSVISAVLVKFVLENILKQS
ncbi:MAG: hypothetical protein WCY00_02780 [Candidatus Dojkabacteria bacterium]|jgi:uncharacterized membrane protein YdbT with pleckstrin-like domain